MVSKELDVEIAKKEHQEFMKQLEKLVKVIIISPDEAYPDCCFIEDTAVIIGKTVLITNMGADSRKGEVTAVISLFKTIKSLQIFDMRNISQD